MDSIIARTSHRPRRAFCRKLVDAVNDLDSVLYEIGNEGDVRSAERQYHIVRYIKQYEARLTLPLLVRLFFTSAHIKRCSDVTGYEVR